MNRSRPSSLSDGASRAQRGGTRRVFVFIHRWLGLVIAGFLVIVGLTGCLISFVGELNHWLAPHVYPGPHGDALAPAALARRAEALVPGSRAITVYLGGESGSARVGLEAAPGVAPLEFSSIILDAVTGDELHRRRGGVLPTAAAEIMPFVYSLHYELAIGATGIWILGIVALIWTIDSFVAFYLTLPLSSPGNSRSYLARWKPAWKIKWSGSLYRINFDLHRAGGLWVWAMLLVFAWSSVYFNLNSVYTGAMSLVSDIEPPPWTWPAQPPRQDGPKMFDWEDAQQVGEKLMAEQAREHGFAIERPDALYFKSAKGLIQYRVRSSRDIGASKATTSILFDAYTGVLVNVNLPTGQRSGNTFTTWIAALHTADVFGLPYRIFVCGLGMVVAMLSVTGVYIWWKKRCARINRRGPAGGSPARVSRSWRSVASVAWTSVTAAAKRTQRLRGVRH
jgi:uncharacterized iron-regulated membrane protein